jgi:hypothetical protein
MQDATGLLNTVADGFEGLASQIAGMIGDNRSFMETWGWNLPPLSSQEVAATLRGSAHRLRNLPVKTFQDEDLEALSRVLQRIEYIRGNVLPQFPGGNAANSYNVIDWLIRYVDFLISRYRENKDEPIFRIEELKDRKLLPAAQINRLINIDRGIISLEEKSGDLQKKINFIDAAHDVAEALPANLQSLEEAKRQYEEAGRALAAITASAQASRDEIELMRARAKDTQMEAEQALSRANRAYGASTTVGLAKAFSEKAASLANTTLFLGFVLLVALSAGAFITYRRVEFVHQLMLKPNVNFNVLWINVTFTALSVSAPVWLAWLVTRQIGQRFRLAEDYSYKAAVAKAYEGYRAEASNIDPELSKRLFETALDMLAEPPLRLVEKESPGSPAHEVQLPLQNLFRRPKSTVTTATESKGGDE